MASNGAMLIQVVEEATLFPRDKIKKLNKIVEKTNCEVVITSAWRANHTLVWFDEFFQEAGYIGSLLSTTPQRNNGNAEQRRQHEIKAWLSAHKTRQYAILDDMDLEIDRFVRTVPSTGLTDEDVEKVIKLLNE